MISTLFCILLDTHSEKDTENLNFNCHPTKGLQPLERQRVYEAVKAVAESGRKESSLCLPGKSGNEVL